MFRFALETAQVHESLLTNRPRRSEPAKTILAWCIGNGRFNQKTDYPQSQTFSRVTHLKDRAGSSRHHQEETQEDPPLTDLNVGAFFSHLKIRLPVFREKTLAEEMAILEKQRAAAKNKRP